MRARSAHAQLARAPIAAAVRAVASARAKVCSADGAAARAGFLVLAAASEGAFATPSKASKGSTASASPDKPKRVSATALAGTLCGALLGCILLALMMSNAGGAWDNAKKYVEDGHFGGKGGETHKGCVVGDTVGDPLKDTSGPSMNIMITVMAIVSLVIAPLLA